MLIIRQIIAALVFVIVGITLFLYPPAISAATPSDFEDVVVANVGGPTALAFTPDARMLITSHFGTLRVYKNGALLTSPAIDISSKLCSDKERGLLGVAVDPDFTTNHYIYIYYTFKKFNTCVENSPDSPVNRVVRFVLPDSNIIDPTTETILVDNIPQPGGIHSAGDLFFGKDGFLYISSGDGGCDLDDGSRCGSNNDNARQDHILLGKILRITKDGGIPPTNPFQGADSGRCNLTGSTDPGKKCQETFSSGLRNPFRFAFDPNSAGTRFYIDDTGQNTWEEISEGQAGADFGWNVREGHCAVNSTTNCDPPPAGMTNPVYDYQHNTIIPTGSTTPCNAITGGAFVPNGVWPQAYNGSYLYSDFTCGTIFRLNPNGTGAFTRTEFVTGLGNQSAVVLEFGPHGSSQALYYTNYLLGGQIHRVAFTGSLNRAPIAIASANPPYGALPLNVNFDGSLSSDPDGDSIGHVWDFGDGSATENGATVSHTYTVKGVYTATLTVSDTLGLTNSTTVRIDAGNTPPTPTIASPSADTRFRVGQPITLAGSAIDTEDGTLSDSALSWRVLLHHDTHIHPFLPPTGGNNIVITAPGPEDLLAATNSYLEIFLTATDPNGLTNTITQNLLPNKVDVSFATSPAGLKLDLNGTNINTPQTSTSWEGYNLNVNAPAQTDSTGLVWEFDSWSDSGAASHTIVTPAAPATYTATFKQTVTTTFTFAPVADARVQEANPNTNYGVSTYLRADGGSDPDVESYMRFTVSGLTGPVSDAKLRMYEYNGTADGPAIYSTDNTWSETAINWSNRPVRTSNANDNKGAIGANTWVEYNVTPLLSGNGTFNFIMATTSSDSSYVYSRENSTNKPQLVITTGTGSADTEVPTTPTNLAASAISQTRIDLSWNPSTDNVGVTGYEIYRNATLLTTIGAQTTYSDTSVVASTAYQYQVKARDAANNISGFSNTTEVTTPPASTTTTLTFAADADSYVRETNPNTNYGVAGGVLVDGSPNRQGYLRFVPSGITGTIQTAKIRLYAYDPTPNGPAIYATSNTWTETGITWSNKPAQTGTASDNKGSISKNTWVEFDVKPLVLGNGTFSFVLIPDSNDGVDMYSRQSTNTALRPQLVVTFSN